MSELTSLLYAADVRRAVIIDDAYEETPIANDLSLDEENWGQFFEDLSENDIKLLRELFPSYDTLRADELRSNNGFVAVLWNNRERLRDEIVGPLFERYIRDKDQDLAYLETLTKCLTQYGIECSTAGRAFERIAAGADLIIIDLYLGSTQNDAAMEFSVNGLKEVMRNRMANPPLVVLMSRSARLKEKRKEFRDSSGLFESAFRIIRKTELAEEGKLTRILMRLAEHYQDSLKLAAFLHAWQTGLSSACARTANLIRTLDLADHAQIRQLLLTEEGEPPGSYLVDVFDLVLQHEIEREASIIDAAIDLNGLNSDAYPPPYVAGSPDLQALVYRSLFHNDGRLRLVKPNGSPVVFGDILCRKLAPAAPAANVPFSDIGPGDVFVVMTPSCDLQHLLAKRVLLLKGSLVPLTPANWSYKETPIRTAVFETSSRERFQIKWDLKHIETISYAELKSILEAPNGFYVVARLRQAAALELQQKLLSNLGRVGLIAPMPATFPVNIEAYLPDASRKLFKIDVPALTDNQGVCFIGRKNDDEARTLVLCEDACEALCDAIQSIDLDTIHPNTRETILGLRASGELLILQKGVDFSGATVKKFQEIISVSAATVEKRAIGLIRRSGEWIDQPLNGSYLKKAGIILVVSDEYTFPNTAIVSLNEV
jgi:hypothetical protein